MNGHNRLICNNQSCGSTNAINITWVLEMQILGVSIVDQRVKNPTKGVPVVALWLTNPTRNHEVAGWIPGLAQWVKDPVLP